MQAITLPFPLIGFIRPQINTASITFYTHTILSTVVSISYNPEREIVMKNTINPGNFEPDSVKFKAHDNILRSAAWLGLKLSHSLKPFKLTSQQYNLLKVLKANYPATLNMRELQEQMIDLTSNASRLVEKLKTKGYVRKEGNKTDNRQVRIQITKEGILLVNEANMAVTHEVGKRLENLNDEEVRTLNTFLEKIQP